MTINIVGRGRRRSRRSLVIAVAVTAMVAALAPAPAAQASNFSGANGLVGCFANMADNRTHTFFYRFITDPARAAVNWTRSNNYDPTEIDTVNDVENTITDVIVEDGDYTGDFCGSRWIDVIGGSGLIGAAVCQSLSGSACQQWKVFFDTDYMGPRSDAAEQALACHELGHTVGLEHYSDGCIELGFHTQNYLTDHDRVHLHNYL